MFGMYVFIKNSNQGESNMTENFSINCNDPYFGAVTVSNPNNSGNSSATQYSTPYVPYGSYGYYSYYCPECTKLRADLTEEKNGRAKDNIDHFRIEDNLRSDINKTKKELSTIEDLHHQQEDTILSLYKISNDKSSTIFEYETKIAGLESELKALKERNLDPEPHALKASILIMQKQLDELNLALAKAKEDHDYSVKDWSDCYDSLWKHFHTTVEKYEQGRRAYQATIDTLKDEVASLADNSDCDCEEENNYCCVCDAVITPTNEVVKGYAEENSALQKRIEEQNRIIGNKQDTINDLKVALGRSQKKQTFEVKPAIEIVKSYEDKIHRLMDIINSKDEIISGLQSGR